MNQYQLTYFCIVFYLKPYFSPFLRLVENQTPMNLPLFPSLRKEILQCKITYQEGGCLLENQD